MQRLAIVGTGLIGASVGLAARAVGVQDVRGWDMGPGALAVAARREAVEPAGSLEEAVADAELAVVAAPVAQLPAEVAAVLAASGDGTTVTDVGSTKGPVARAVTDGRFIGGHPGFGSPTPRPPPPDGGRFPGAAGVLAPGPGPGPPRPPALPRLLAPARAPPGARAPPRPGPL